jgi:tRNA pseudouridine13 synthase
LRRGAHKSNAFRIALRSKDAAAMRQSVDDRLAGIAARGVPNYFGPQRFGHHGANLSLARSLFAGARMKRDRRGIAISAARSFLFNQILSARVADGSWQRILPGEMVNLDGSGSVFHAAAVDETIERRAAGMDVHPTGTLWGLRSDISKGAIEALQRDATEAHADLRAVLEGMGIKASYRPLRVRVADLSWDYADDALWLEFLLPAGGFATAVLREVASV